MWKFEAKKCFTSKKWLIALLTGIIISICHVSFSVYPLVKWLDSWQGELYIIPHSAYLHWIGVDSSTVWPTLLYLLFPILTVFPFADSAFWERESGYSNQIYIRSERKNYCIQKSLVCFISAASIVLITLIFDFLLTVQFLPLVRPEVSTGLCPISDKRLFAEIFYAKPLLYVFIFIILDSIMYGAWSLLALGFAHVMRNRAQIITLPLIIYLIIYFICYFTKTNSLSLYAIALPFQPIPNVRIINYVGYLVVLVLLGPIQFWLFDARKDRI